MTRGRASAAATRRTRAAGARTRTAGIEGEIGPLGVVAATAAVNGASSVSVTASGSEGPAGTRRERTRRGTGPGRRRETRAGETAETPPPSGATETKRRATIGPTTGNGPRAKNIPRATETGPSAARRNAAAGGAKATARIAAKSEGGGVRGRTIATTTIAMTMAVANPCAAAGAAPDAATAGTLPEVAVVRATSIDRLAGRGAGLQRHRLR